VERKMLLMQDFITTPVPGIPELRKRLRKFQREVIDWKPENVVISPGQHSL
jgi:hypothetical protein